MKYPNAFVITGGIATGKSTVCLDLQKRFFGIIDADKIAKKVLELSKSELKRLFGNQIFDKQRINKKQLSKIIFSSKHQREKLNALVHPKIRLEILKQADKREKLGLPYFVDIPLFFESDEYHEFQTSVVVYSSKDLQLKRLIKRDDLTIIEAKQRVQAQIDIETKKRDASWVIDNSKDLIHLKNEIREFIGNIKDIK